MGLGSITAQLNSIPPMPTQDVRNFQRTPENCPQSLLIQRPRMPLCNNQSNGRDYSVSTTIYQGYQRQRAHETTQVWRDDRREAPQMPKSPYRGHVRHITRDQRQIQNITQLQRLSIRRHDESVKDDLLPEQRPRRGHPWSQRWN